MVWPTSPRRVRGRTQLRCRRPTATQASMWSRGRSRCTPQDSRRGEKEATRRASRRSPSPNIEVNDSTLDSDHSK
eukprot:3208201-Pyramimonas_sp.AAC.1